MFGRVGLRILEKTAIGQDFCRYIFLCKVPSEQGDEITRSPHTTLKYHFGIRILARKNRELVADRESSDFHPLPALRLHLTDRLTHHGVEMTHLHSAITPLILTLF